MRLRYFYYSSKCFILIQSFFLFLFSLQLKLIWYWYKNADFWFWTSKVASRKMDSPCCLPNWRHIRVCQAVSISTLIVITLFSSINCMFYAYFKWFQIFGSRILHAWNCRWEDRCICLWGFTAWAHNRSSCSWLKSTKSCNLGMIQWLITIANFIVVKSF